ncbi:hypothetical protein NC651_022309 [Populus alba x Populus x berolinensis]|nr:hypothetical protein NC651_022309 [Populus alba x Populus x berolinensis]
MVPFCLKSVVEFAYHAGLSVDQEVTFYNLNFSRQPHFCCPWQIPGNTGCIARTCAATAVGLHLVGPLGFQVDDAKLKRAGLDYWPYPCTSSVKGSFS